MTDIIRTTAVASAIFLSAISPIGANAKKFNTPKTTTSSMVSVAHLWDTNDGSVGRLSIGGYSANLYQSNSQSTVDAYDSAAYMPWGNIVMIADHASQGFSVIRSCGAGSVGTITDNSTITYLTCASSYQGTNTGNGINLADGRYAETVGDGSYMLYTCNDSTGVSVTVTYWYVSGVEAIAPAYVEPEPVYEAPAPTYEEAAPVEESVSQSVVDTTSNEQTQQAVSQTSTEPVKADKVDTTTVPDFAEATQEIYNSFKAELENQLHNLLTANKQGVDKQYSSYFEKENLVYYVDNRQWLALSSARGVN